jgi:multidrug resistance protein, MATE family
MTMGLVDAALVGRVSEADLSAVSMGNSLTFALMCPAMGVMMAVGPLASQAVGAEDPERAWISLRAGVLTCFVLSVPTVLVIALSPEILPVMGVDPVVVPLARAFVYGRLPGVPGFLLFMAGKAYLEARGMLRPLFIGAGLGNILNFAVASVLVFGDAALIRVGMPALGIPVLGSKGAGWSTSVANLVLAAIALGSCWAVRPPGATLLGRTAELRANARKVLRVGVPIGFQILTEVGVFSLVSLLAGRLGARVSAAHQIALGLASFTFMGVLGMSSATAVRVGRAIGAGEERGPRRAGLVGGALVGVYMVGCAALFVLAPRPLAALFSHEPEVLDAAVQLVRVAAAFQIFDGIQGVAGGALRGAADTRYASIANVVCHWGIGLPLALLLGFTFHFGAVGMWWGLSAGLLVVAGMLSARFWRVSGRRIEAV